MLVGLLIGLYEIFGLKTKIETINKLNRISPGILLVVGIGTLAAMGFSPTIYASGARTCLFMLLVFEFLILCITNRFKSKTDTGQRDAVNVIGYMLLISCGCMYIYSVGAFNVG